MEQKVKLQFTCDLVDVAKFSGLTLQDANLSVTELQELVQDAKYKLTRISHEDLESLKQVLEIFDKVKVLLLKIDNRMADTAAVIGGLVQYVENPNIITKEEANDSISTG